MASFFRWLTTSIKGCEATHLFETHLLEHATFLSTGKDTGDSGFILGEQGGDCQRGERYPGGGSVG